jgi:hypothetical protein
MSNPEIDSKGNKRWFKDGTRTLHRLEGPAIEGVEGSKEWRVNGKLHRLDGPAYDGYNGTREFWVDGKLHRLDGPAIDWLDLGKQWWVDDEQVSEEDYPAAVLLYKCKLVLES